MSKTRIALILLVVAVLAVVVPRVVQGAVCNMVAPSGVYRGHWDHFAVNPALIGTTPTVTPTVTATATIAPTATPTATTTATPAPTGACRVQWNPPGPTGFQTLGSRTLTKADCQALLGS